MAVILTYLRMSRKCRTFAALFMRAAQAHAHTRKVHNDLRAQKDEK